MCTTVLKFPPVPRRPFGKSRKGAAEGHSSNGGGGDSAKSRGTVNFFKLKLSIHLVPLLPPISASEPRSTCSPPMIPRSSSNSSSPRMLQCNEKNDEKKTKKGSRQLHIAPSMGYVL